MALWRHRDSVTRSWGPLLCHCSTTVTSCCSMTHSPVFQGPPHGSRKPRTSQFLQGWKIDRTCLPSSLFGMLWIRVDDSVLQFLPISSNFPQPVKRTDIPQASISNLINAEEMCFAAWGNWWSNQILREIVAVLFVFSVTFAEPNSTSCQMGPAPLLPCPGQIRSDQIRTD